jgi:glycolate dehydrogenase FAD-binding subunit
MSAQDPMLARIIDQVDGARAREAPLEIRGGGSKWFLGETAPGEPLDVTCLTGITSYEPTELVVTVRAGTRLADLEAALQEHGQCLPFEPPRFAAGGTVGGMVAAGLSGPARATSGSVRDHVLGVTLLNGRGEILTFGGQVAKNVAGYDVSRLMAGSLGILGVICEVSLKVLPISTATATLCFDCDSGEALAKFREWSSQPLAISATAWHEGLLHVRLAGAGAAVASACTRLGGTQLAPQQAESWWMNVRDHSHAFFALDSADVARGESLWRLSVPATAPPLELSGLQFIEWGGAERWCKTSAAAGQVRRAAAGLGGHATLIRGADKSCGVFAPLSDVSMRIHRGLKQAFDPLRIFNRGRMYAGL